MAYEGIDFSPPQGAVDAARRALEWVAEFGRGGTSVGRTTARMLASGDPMPPQRVRRMWRYFPRHEVDKQAEGFNAGEDGYPSNGRIAWDLWGGDIGQRWSTRKVNEMNKWDEEQSKNAVMAPETKELMLTGPAVIDKDGNVKGVAAAFGNLDRHGDIILPGAFDRALTELRSMSDVAFLWNHSSDHPLGPLKSLSVGPGGLTFDGQVVPTTWGKDVQLLLKTGTVKKMSFGYRVNRAAYVDDAVGLASAMAHFGVKPEWSAVITAEASKAFDAGVGVRLLVDLDPWEVSLVPVPANPRAELVGKGITAAEAKGAAPFRDYAFSALDYSWDADNAVSRIKRWAEADDGANAAYRSAFAWYDSDAPSEFGSYRLPIADVVEGKLVIVPGAVYAAARAVADGEAGIPEDDVARVKSLLERYYKAIADRFGDSTIIPPWKADDVGKGLTPGGMVSHNADVSNDEASLMVSESKAGRVLSASNVKRLQSLRSALADGVKALDEVFRIAGVMDEDEPKGGGMMDDDDNEDDDDELKSSTPNHATADDLAGLFRFN